LIGVSYVCYSALGSDLLPAMDEGGFILDYVMPAGSSLQETNRVISHVEQIIRSVPEVESTSRRTGLQLGLAAVTEPNTGDISVKLKDKRSRGIDDIISQVRAQVKKEEPVLDVDFTQVLQDMISDLTGAPEPIVMAVFSRCGPSGNSGASSGGRTWARLCEQQEACSGYRRRHRKHDERAGSHLHGQSLGRCESGLHTDQLTTIAAAIVDGEPTVAPVIVNDRPYTLRVRYPAGKSSFARSHEQYGARQFDRGDRDAGFQCPPSAKCPARPKFSAIIYSRRKKSRRAWKGLDLGTGVAEVQKKINEMHLPPSLRVEYGGTYKEQQKSFHDLAVVLLLALVLIFLVLLFEFRSFSAPDRNFGLRGAFDIRRVSCPVDHANHFQYLSRSWDLSWWWVSSRRMEFSCSMRIRNSDRWDFPLKKH
jgi:hypothetical protein